MFTVLIADAPDWARHPSGPACDPDRGSRRQGDDRLVVVRPRSAMTAMRRHQLRVVLDDSDHDDPKPFFRSCSVALPVFEPGPYPFEQSVSVFKAQQRWMAVLYHDEGAFEQMTARAGLTGGTITMQYGLAHAQRWFQSILVS